MSCCDRCRQAVIRGRAPLSDLDQDQPLHYCPYLAEIEGDKETLCNCCPEHEESCYMDI